MHVVDNRMAHVVYCIIMNRVAMSLVGVAVCTFAIGCQTTTEVVSVSLTEQAVLQNTQEVTTLPPEAPVVEPIDPLIIYFGKNSSEISERAQSALRALSYVILQNMDSVQAIDVTGHVAFAGTKTGRSRISKDRSEQAAQYLIELGVPQSLLKTTSDGANQPAATNDTEEGRALNRRANIVVIQE